MTASHRDDTNADSKVRYIDIEVRFIDELENIARVAKLLAMQEGVNASEKAYLSEVERLALDCLEEFNNEDSVNDDPKSDANAI